MSSCFGMRKRSKPADEEALLPEYGDDTALQRSLHQKMHSYQMIRAIAAGFMPSTEQLIINLRTLMASDPLNPENPELSDSGRHLLRYSKTWLGQFSELLQHKNSNDQIQDFIWFLSKARISLDTDQVTTSASKIKARADAAAAYESLHTVGSLLLTNSDFRLFLGDLNTIGRQVFSDTAFTLSSAAEETAQKVKPTSEDLKAIEGPGADAGPAPASGELGGEVTDVTKAVQDGLAKTGAEALSSIQDNVSGDQKDTLLFRLKTAISKLRKRNDYSDSVSTLALLIQRYSLAYSRAADATLGEVQSDVRTNDELDRAVQNFWTLFKSFGDPEAWENLEEKLKKVLQHAEKDPDFESLMTDIGNSVQKMLTDPAFFDSADKKFEELREKSKSSSSGSSLRQDVDAALLQLRRTLHSIMQDADVGKLITTSTKILAIVSPADKATNPDLIDDALHVFIPLLIQAVQYVPIPRIEVSTPDLDLLLENLIIEPGRTVNNTSFLPFRLAVSTQNDLEIRKARFRTKSSVRSLTTIKIDGLSVRAEEVGFWLRAHSGLFRLADEGIASIQLDERGIDIHLDVEVGRDRMEKILSLRDVRVHVHKFRYTLRRSRFSWLAWLLTPILRPILRKTIESEVASAVADALHFANRELIYARERLRATRIADPQDLATFVKAVLARLVPEEDPDLYTSVGVRPSKGIFRGVYAPGSIVKLWEDEARRAGERVEDFEIGGWRNAIFDVHTRIME